MNWETLHIGHGYDVHRLVYGRALILCGVTLPHDQGLLGHSDADVATHALMDAILSAARLPDIGQLFPDTSDRFKAADSCELLDSVMKRIRELGWELVDADLTIAAERPKLAPYKEEMREKLAQVMGVQTASVGLTATTTEGLGFTGRGEGIEAWATVLLGKSGNK